MTNDNAKGGFGDVWAGMTRLARRLVDLESRPEVSIRVGAARPLAPSERIETWREITINGQTLRVVTVEDEQ